MQKSSWIMLGIVAALSAFLVFTYVASRSGPVPMTEAQANALLNTLKDAVAHKNVNTIMNTISPDPDTRIAEVGPEKLRTFLFQGFHGAGQLEAQTANVRFQGGDNTASLDFDMTVNSMQQNLTSQLWKGHVTLELRPVDVPQFLGLYHTKDWRITGAQTDGPSPSSFGDF